MPSEQRRTIVDSSRGWGPILPPPLTAIPPSPVKFFPSTFMKRSFAVPKHFAERASAAAGAQVAAFLVLQTLLGLGVFTFSYFADSFIFASISGLLQSVEVIVNLPVCSSDCARHIASASIGFISGMFAYHAAPFLESIQACAARAIGQETQHEILLPLHAKQKTCACADEESSEQQA
uniref:ER membrane protein complex subunit 6 n=1 Tax=Mycena chlorophos TaxID=658473 RepID=A0ABQ0LF02_MYCCL|nr:predicted protein [Mycena chlorophos]